MGVDLSRSTLTITACSHHAFGGSEQVEKYIKSLVLLFAYEHKLNDQIIKIIIIIN